MLLTALRWKPTGGGATTDIRVTQQAVEVIASPPADVRVTQQALETIWSTTPAVRVTQQVVEVLRGPLPYIRITQQVVEVVRTNTEETYEPGQSFGPLVWAEVVGPDNVTRAYAPVTLPDPAAYYSGCKPATLLGVGRIARALSDEQGQYESQRFSTTLDDMDRTWRDWLGDSATRLILNDRVVVRMISEPSWRAKLRPRTVAIGLVRDYRLE